jgi:MYXO-CTERM domain-containing protein
VRRIAVLPALILTAASLFAQPPPALTIDAPPALAPARARLESYDLQTLSDIVRLVGLEAPGPPVRVVLADDDSEWARRVAPWTAGLAIGDADLIVLFPTRSPVYPHDSLEDVLRHEVAHVMIDRAAAGRPVPRWFHEGLAVAAERPWGLEDRSRLAWELLRGPRLTLDEIDGLFSGGQAAQTRAYTLAAAVVRDLMREHGGGTPATILRGLAGGRSFEEAMASVTARPLPSLEAEFWSRQRRWTVWIPIVTSTTVLWLGVLALAALAVRRRRRHAEDIRRRWAEEEEAATPADASPHIHCRGSAPRRREG